MRRFLPGTLFGQLVLGIMLMQSLFLIGFVSYIVISQRNIAQERTEQRIAQQLNRLAEACSRPLGNGDMAGVHDALELSRIAPTIDVARLTDLQGKTLAMTNNGRSNELDADEKAVLLRSVKQQIFQIRNGQTEAVTPILRNGEPVALVWIEPNHALSLNTLNTVVRICLNYGILALIINIIPIFLIARAITRPLRRLGEGTRAVIRNPDLDAGFPLPVTTRNEAGQLTISFNTMVRELQQQRNGLLETLALLDSMLGNAPIGFAFFDSGLRFVRLNQFLASMSGTTIDEHVGRRVTELYPGSMAAEIESRVTGLFQAGSAIRDVELSEDGREGERRRTWLMHFYPVRTEADAVRWVGVIVVEITDRLRTEEALRKTEKLATAGRLAASIAHEINNPLESVTNLLYLLEHHEPMDQVATGYVTTAQAELARVSEITQQTLRFYRQPTSPTLTNIAEVLDSILALYQPRIHALHVTVNKRYRQAEILALSGELRQLFANLIGNALDAMPTPGSLTLRTRRGCGLGADGVSREGVRVSISDTGTGMSEETRRRIFEAFFTTKQATGTGLGLWLSDEIVRKHSGTVRVRSRQGTTSGTTFMMFFPDGGLREHHIEVNEVPAAPLDT